MLIPAATAAATKLVAPTTTAAGPFIAQKSLPNMIGTPTAVASQLIGSQTAVANQLIIPQTALASQLVGGSQTAVASQLIGSSTADANQLITSASVAGQLIGSPTVVASQQLFGGQASGQLIGSPGGGLGQLILPAQLVKLDSLEAASSRQLKDKEPSLSIYTF